MCSSEGAEVQPCSDRNEVGMWKGWSRPEKLQNGKNRVCSWKASFIYHVSLAFRSICMLAHIHLFYIKN